LSSTANYGKKLQAGDEVGLSIDFESGEIHVFINGVDQGLACKSEKVKTSTFYACCAFRCKDDSVTIIDDDRPKKDVEEPSPLSKLLDYFGVQDQKFEQLLGAIQNHFESKKGSDD